MFKSGKSLSLLEWIGIGLVFYTIGGRGLDVFFQGISFSFPRINVRNVSLIGADATIRLNVTNSNPAGATLDWIRANIFYGDFALAAIETTRPTDIAGNTTTELIFETRLDFAQLATNITALIASRQFLQQLRVAGSTRSNGVVFPFNQQITLV